MDRWIKLLIQFIKFGVVGLSNTIILFSIYYLFVYFNPDLYLIGNTVGFIVSVLNSYYWNRKYVFKSEEKLNTAKPLIKTIISYGFTYVLGMILLFVMVEYFEISELIAPVINLIITVPLNFLLNKFWAFK